VGNGASGSGTDNGNVFGITNYKDITRNRTFIYDPLNRLTSAQNGGWPTLPRIFYPSPYRGCPLLYAVKYGIK
jgi:hypothetical protein